MICLPINQKVHMAYKFNIQVLLKVTGSHTHRMCGDIVEMVQDKERLLRQTANRK